MITNGFYIIKNEYYQLIKDVGGKYNDSKERPLYCCIQDKNNPEIYWAIPTSELAHRNQTQINKINKYISLPENDIRSSYYEIGHTNKKAIFKISNALPLTEKYIDHEYTSNGKHLLLKNTVLISKIQKKLKRILQVEGNHPDFFEQKKTSLYKRLENDLKQQNKELEQEKSQNQKESTKPKSNVASLDKKEPLDLKAYKQKAKEYNDSRSSHKGNDSLEL